MPKLTIGASGFSLPLDAVTTTIGVLGIRGSGKSHTATVIAEEMLGAALQVILLDPLDCLWGLRTSADGKGPGYPVTVLGGEHADIPLEASSGPVVADFAVAHGASLVLSLRHFSKTDQRRFVAEFCERVYRLKGKSENRSPLHVIIDEADEVAPQRLGHGSERCFGAVDTLVRRGRSSGIGVTLISQRAAAVNKDVLTQIELLITHRVISPQDRKAVALWIEAHPVGDRADKMADSLASLQKGECWVWSPSWLAVFEKIQVRQRRTFDSSATPKIGARVIAPSGRATVNLESLRTVMAETIKKTEENDPAKLRKRIAELERQKVPVADHSECRAMERELWVRNKRIGGAIETAIVPLQKIPDCIDALLRCIVDLKPTIEILDVHGTMRSNRSAPLPATAPILPHGLAEIQKTKRQFCVTESTGAGNGDHLPKAKRGVLTALAQYPQGRNRTQVALLSGYSQGSGSFGQTLAQLRADGLIDGGGDLLQITDRGRAALGDFEELPTGPELIAYWVDRLSKCEGEILQCVVRRHPRLVDREMVAEATGYSPGSGSFGQALATLRALGLITRGSEFTLGDEVLS